MVIDNFSTGKREVVPSVPRLDVVEGSIADQTLVASCFDRFKPELVVHAAASYKDPTNWHEDAQTNVVGSIHVAKTAAAHAVSRLINLQTALCYGRPATLPIPITHPTAPFTSYGITKTAGEQFMLMSGVPTVSLRLANITGPRLSIGPIPTFYMRLKAGQKCFCSDTRRDFLDMSDFFALMDLAIRADAPIGVFNVSTGEGHTIKEIFELVAAHLELTGLDVPVLPPGDDDVPAVVLDPRETERMFNWNAKVSFGQAIARQLTWYDSFGVTDVHSHLAAPAVSEQTIHE
jgi:nucleoside-diphosphate-sugar epimerase